MTTIEEYIKNKNLRNLIVKHPIDNEKILFEGNGNLICEKCNIGHETKGTIFVTTNRIGFINENNNYYFTNIEYIRNILYLDERKRLYIMLTDKEHQSIVAEDYEVVISDLEEYEDFATKIFKIYEYRFNYPIEVIDRLLNKVILLSSNGMFNESLEILENIKKLDGMTGVVDLLKARVYKLMGKNNMAQITLLKRFSRYTYYSENVILRELYNYDFGKQALKEISELTVYDEIDEYTVNMLKAKSKNNKEECIKESLNIIMYLINNSNYESAFYIAIKILINNFDINKNQDLKKIQKSIKKILMGIVQRNDELIGVEEIEFLMDACRNYMNEPSKFIEKLICYYDREKRLIYENRYDELLKLELKKQPNKQLKVYNLNAIQNYNIVDNHELYCNNLIVKLFAAVRSKQFKNKELVKMFIELSEILNKENSRYYKGHNKFELMLYYIVACEIYLINSKKQKALEVIYECRTSLKYEFGKYIHETLTYGKEIMDFYEGWAFKSFLKMKEAIVSIPQDKLSWINELYEDIKNIEDFNINNQIESKKEAFKVLKNIVVNFIDISDEYVIDDDFKRNIKNSINNITERLGESELRIAIVGETGNGKTTFLNTMFNTELFFTTQEEATGVSTEIRKGEKIQIQVFDKNGQVRSAYNTEKGSWFDNGSKSIENMNSQEFILKHTKVNEEALEWVDNVKVTLPIDDLPNELVIIDTPGFNAHEARTKIAQSVIEDAHVCIFLIDARNALKGREMEVLNLVREEAGKTFFVLNKMDLIEGDDELDCDGDDTIDELLDRVERDIKKYFNLKRTNVYPVACIKPNNEENIRFFNNIVILKKAIFEEALSQKLDLIIDMAAKEAVKVSNEISEFGELSIGKSKEKEDLLMESLPDDPELFRDDIEKRISNQYYKLKDQYIDTLNIFIKGEMTKARDKYYFQLNKVSSRSDLKDKAQNMAERILRSTMDLIQNKRVEELKNMSEKSLEEVNNIFKELYRNLPFETSFEVENLFKNITKINYDLKGALNATVTNIEASLEMQGGAGLIGAGIGLLLGPLGAIAGGVIGASLFGESLDNMKIKVGNAFDEAFDKSYDNIIEICSSDLSNDNNSFINKLLDVIDKEILKYENIISIQAEKANNDLKEAVRQTFLLKEKQFAIENNIELLNIWRSNRKN